MFSKKKKKRREKKKSSLKLILWSCISAYKLYDFLKAFPHSWFHVAYRGLEYLIYNSKSNSYHYYYYYYYY